MAPVSRLTPLALALLFAFGHAQAQATAAIGLEVPAPAAPREGHFLTGTYVSGNYSPVLMPGSPGYTVQPYLRYVLGREGRNRPFVQYSFAPYRRQAYGFDALSAPGDPALPASPGFAPLAQRGLPYNAYTGYGGLGAFSVGVPLRAGRTSAVLNIAGSLLEGVRWTDWR